jgi:hypothetical protein
VKSIAAATTITVATSANTNASGTHRSENAVNRSATLPSLFIAANHTPTSERLALLRFARC